MPSRCDKWNQFKAISYIHDGKMQCHQFVVWATPLSANFGPSGQQTLQRDHQGQLDSSHRLSTAGMKNSGKN